MTFLVEPQPIRAAYVPEGPERRLAVNAVSARDANIVFSFNADGTIGRDAIGLSPYEALVMARALTAAATTLLLAQQDYDIVDITTGEKLAGQPTPMLLEQGGGDAWDQHPGIWRLKDRDDPAGITYRRVSVTRKRG